MEDKTKVEGAGVLSELFKLLFKGIDNILDNAAEYEKEMGVLKQVTRIPVLDKDNKEWEVKVKLAPIKDKDGLFYVEIESDYPSFNGSRADKKPMSINKQNIDDFNKLIEQVLQDNQLTEINDEEDNKEVESDKSTRQCYDNKEFIEWDENGRVEDEPEIYDVDVTIVPLTDKEDTFSIDLKCDKRPLELDKKALQEVKKSKVEDAIYFALKDNNLIELDRIDDLEESTASSHLDVSLSYIKSSDEVNLSAIYANYDVGQAMEALQQIIDDDEFVATLTEEPQSFRITDEGDTYDIALIDEVDTSNSACDIYTAICALSGMLDAYSINLDTQQQAAAAELATALAKAQAVFTPTDQLDPL